MPSAALTRLLRPTRAATVLVAILLCAATAPLFATSPLALAVEDTGSTPAGPKDQRPIVLVGDRPTILPTGGSRLAVALETTAGILLGSPVVDQTSSGLTLDQVQKQTQQVAALRPRAVLVFAGPADKTAGVRDEEQIYSLQSFARALTASGASVFVLPASTDLDAAAAANLRIGATGAGDRVSFVDLGGELGGRPFEEALENIRRTLDTLPATGPAVQPAVLPASAPELSLPPSALTPKPETAPDSGPETAKPSAETKPASKLPAALAGTPKAKLGTGELESAETAETTSGQVRAVGADATPAILRMRPPAPLKQFSPRRPSPNKPTDKKKPAFDR